MLQKRSICVNSISVKDPIIEELDAGKSGLTLVRSQGQIESQVHCLKLLQGQAVVALSVASPWRIAILGGVAEAVAELGGLNLAGLEVKGGFNTIRLDLPTPSSMVPIRLAGGASEIIVRSPAGVATRINFKGRATELAFDNQTFSVAGNISQLQSPGFDPTAPYYDIEITSYANIITITSS